jgi:hypothetical protein
MQFLIELGDTNKDGALDRDEIKKLVAARATTPSGFGTGGFRPDFGTGPGASLGGGFVNRLAPASGGGGATQ